MVHGNEKVKEEKRAREAMFFCPLYSAAFGVLYPCIKEKCMWWGGELRGCAIQALFDLTTAAEGLVEVR
ncbi:MAG: hypothetical protein LM590_09215 [Thermofilum sp.]|nr:hypothetical protein [Thermofilum sp.]